MNYVSLNKGKQRKVAPALTWLCFSYAYLLSLSGDDLARILVDQNDLLLEVRDSTCIFTRGLVGEWVEDMASSSNKEDDQVATYRWEDSYRGNNETKGCDFYLMTKQGICSLLQNINKEPIHRVFILGDSMAEQVALSFWSLIGESVPPVTVSADIFADALEDLWGLRVRDQNFRATVDCPANKEGGAQFEFVLEYARNDKISNDLSPVDMRSHVMNCDERGNPGYCYPWVERYTSDPRRTLFVVNTGAHHITFEDFKFYFDIFMIELDKHIYVSRPDDIMLFRTTSPGHWEIDRTQPYKSYAEYETAHDGINDIYHWKLFNEYNKYALEEIDRRSKTNIPDSGYKRKKMLILPLDVYPMTILRPDSHVDYLHYKIHGGPVDWWNHLMISNLEDIATSLQQQEVASKGVEIESPLSKSY